MLVVGAGPVGLITALKLAYHGVRCMLVERNLETTRWPKMDITNVRTMELLRTLGLADGLREQGKHASDGDKVLGMHGLIVMCLQESPKTSHSTCCSVLVWERAGRNLPHG